MRLHEEKAIHTQTEARAHYCAGKYIPLGRIAWLEGGGKLGWEQAPLGAKWLTSAGNSALL